MKKSILIAALVTATASNFAGATEILLNAGFENGSKAPWVNGNGAPAITSLNAHSGMYSVMAYGSDQIKQNFSAIATSDIQKVSFWAQRNGGAFDYVQFFYSDNTSSGQGVFGTGNDWTFFDVTSMLQPGKMLTGFGVYGTSPGPAYLDDFSILSNVSDVIAVPEPTSTALFCLGLLGLVARRRSKPSV